MGIVVDHATLHHTSLFLTFATLPCVCYVVPVPAASAALPTPSPWYVRQLYFKFFNKPLQMEGYLTESQRRGKTAFNLSTLLAKLTDTVKLVARPNGQHEVQLVAQLVEGDASALASVMASHAPQPPSRIAASDYDFSLAARAGLSDCLPMNGPSSATTSGSGVDNAASCMAMVGPLSSSVPDGTYDMLSLAATLNGLSSSGARFASSSALSQLCELSSMVGHGGSGLPLHRSPSTPTLSMLANAFSNSTLASSPAPIGRGVMSARGAGGAGIPIDPLSKLTLLQGTPLGARVAGTTGGGSSGGNVATPAAPGELCGIYLTFANAPDLEGLGVDDLRRYFGAYGTVLDARIPKQPRSKIGGFAFVIFDTPGAADAALAEERHVIGRVQVLVKPYREGGKKAGVTGGSGNGGATGSSPPTGLGLFGPHGRPLGPNGKSAPSPLPGMSRGIDIHGSSNSLSSAGTSGSSASPPGSYSPTNDNAFLSMAALGASGLPPGMSIAHRSGPLPLAGGGVVGGGLSRGSAGYVGAPGMMAGGAAAARLRAASFGSDPSSGFPPMVVDAGEYELLLSGVMRAQAADLQSRSAALQQQQQLQRLQNQQAAAQQLHQQQAALLQQQQQLIQQQQQRVLLAAQEEQRVLHQQQASLAHLQQQQQQQAAAMSGLNLAYARGGPLPPAATDLLSSGRSSSSGSLNTLSLTMPGSSSHEDADADPSVWDSARSDGNRLSQAISSASSIGPLLDAGNRLGGPLAKGVGERLLGEGAPRPPAPQRAVSQRCADAAPVALGGEMDKSFFGCGFPWTPGTSLWGTGTLGLTSMSAWNPAGQTDEAARRLQANW
eukprot:jgi/Mesvir1/20642/Mv14863-RA.1